MENETASPQGAQIIPLPQMNAQLKKLWESGIPIHSAQFQAEVDNANGIPNIKYDLDSGNKERRIEMVWTPHGLLCKQKSEIWLVPPSNIRSAVFK